jgi:hypothetical protein
LERLSLICWIRAVYLDDFEGGSEVFLDGNEDFIKEGLEVMFLLED